METSNSKESNSTTPEFIRETPDFVIAKMLEYVVKHFGDRKFYEVLEPSCGEGKILEGIRNLCEVGRMNPNYTGVELNGDKVEVARSKGFKVTKGDYLALEMEMVYDLILACPPFKGEIDMEHIKKMWEELRQGGVIVSLTSVYWMTNNEPKHKAFREWLAKKNHYVHMLPDNTFMEKGKSVNTAIIVIW